MNKSPNQHYPLFKNPTEYLQCREGSKATRGLKRKKEWKAIDRCLDVCDSLKSVCDVPCGPGRLFPYWHERNLDVYGVELSDDMLQSARALHTHMKLLGSIDVGDAFGLKNHNLAVDLVACVRFVYYFNAERRQQLLQSLSSISNRYLLLQYKTLETWKGRRNARRPSANSGNPFEKNFVTNDEIDQELVQSGLRLLAIRPISQLSDRAYVIAEKIDSPRN